MKALHVVGDSKFGGGSNVVLQLAQLGQRLGWDVDVLTTDGQFQRLLESRGIGVMALDVIWRDIRPWRDARGCWQLTRAMRRGGYALVHTHTSKAGFVGRVAAAMAGVPAIVHTVHGFAFHEQSGRVALHAYRGLEVFASRFCHRIVTVSHFHRRWALELGIGDASRVVAIPNGIADTRTDGARRAAMRRELDVHENESMILTTGRLSPQKGLEVLIDACAHIDRERRIRVFLVGEGPLEAALQSRVAARSVEEKVTFLGFRSDIPDLLSASDLVVLPSLREGLSIALLEAMAAGKPIVTTSIGSNREATDEGSAALLVPSNNVVGLAEAICRLLSDSQEAEGLARRARARYEGHYREAAQLAAYEELYRNVLIERGIVNQTLARATVTA